MIACHGSNNAVYNAHEMWVHIMHGSALYTAQCGTRFKFSALCTLLIDILCWVSMGYSISQH